MSSLATDLANRMRTQLIRSSVVTASRWAREYRKMQGDFPGPWSFETHPWLLGMHDSEHELNVGQKAAQMGYSETAFNIALYNLDIMRRNVLYILPNERPDAHDFSARIFTPAVELSEHIKGMFGSINNVGHKIAGEANLFIRGSNSRSGLKSVPASVLIYDEFDEMSRESVELAEERQSGQKYRLNWKISTPTTPGRGINVQFKRSTQDHFYFNCPCCSKLIELRFPDNLVITGDDPDDPNIRNSHLICSECRNVLPHEDKRRFLKTGRWVSNRPGQLIRGFYINQLYSAVLEPYKLAIKYLESKRDPAAEMEFFNSKMGLPHIPDGAQITEDMFVELIKGYEMMVAHRPGSVITMGVDVGKISHVEICQWDLSKANPLDINADARCRVLWAGEVPTQNDFAMLASLMNDYNVNFCVIDAMPETQMATAFANKFYGRVRICRYNHFATARSVFAGEKDISVSVNRTAWLDQSLGRFRNGSIILPRNLPRDYVQHIMCPVRRPVKDNNGQLSYKYEEQEGRPDHYAHARNYAEIALMFATGHAVHKTITERV
jgi:hypothetical protein